MENPLEAAIAKEMEFVRSLHEDLQTFVEDYQTNMLRAFASLLYKETKLQQMINTPSYIPSNCRFKCPLKILEEARQGKEFSALEGRQQALLQNTFVKLGEFVIKDTKLN